jgi:hypothetical protein
MTKYTLPDILRKLILNKIVCDENIYYSSYTNIKHIKCLVKKDDFIVVLIRDVSNSYFVDGFILIYDKDKKFKELNILFNHNQDMYTMNSIDEFNSMIRIYEKDKSNYLNKIL